MVKYPRKTIYFKADNVDLYTHLESMGKQASEYICRLIREDIEGDSEATDELILEEIQRLREDLKCIRIEIETPDKYQAQSKEAEEAPGIELADEFNGLLLD